jgi:hypothetical protein
LGRTSALDKDGVARWTMAYDERGNKVEEAYFGTDGKARYSYAEGDQPISVIYLDERGKIIAVEVKVKETAAGSTAERIGLAPGDRLLSYASERLRSFQQLVFLTGKGGAGARKFVYRCGAETFTAEVPPGRLGVVVANVRAAAPPPGQR